MPLLHFHLIDGRNPGDVEALLDAAHGAVVEAFGVPATDRYQIVATHPRHEVIAMDTGLRMRRSDELVIIEIVSRPRTRTQKESLYRLLADRLHRECGLERDDLIVTITENTDDDWSFGGGRAQFITGELSTT